MYRKAIIEELVEAVKHRKKWEEQREILVVGEKEEILFDEEKVKKVINSARLNEKEVFTRFDENYSLIENLGKNKKNLSFLGAINNHQVRHKKQRFFSRLTNFICQNQHLYVENLISRVLGNKELVSIMMHCHQPYSLAGVLTENFEDYPIESNERCKFDIIKKPLLIIPFSLNYDIIAEWEKKNKSYLKTEKSELSLFV